MRLVSYRSEQAIRVAGVRNGEFVDLNRTDPELPSQIIPLLSRGTDALQGAGQCSNGGRPWIEPFATWSPPFRIPKK